MEWTDEHLRIFLDSIKYVDGSCSDCIEKCIKRFLDLTSWDLLEALDRVGPTVKWDYGDKWEMMRPSR